MRWPLLFLMLVLVGCGERSQIQLVADAKATAQAFHATPAGPEREKIAEALADTVLAATTPIPGLPAPSLKPEEIQANPQAWAENALKSSLNPPKYIAKDQPKGASPSSILDHIGTKMLIYGAIAGGVGIALLIVAGLGFGGAILAFPFVLPAIRLIASTGVACTLVGSTMSYISDYWGWIVAAGVVAAGVMGYMHRKDIKTVWTKIRPGKQQP